MKTITFPLKLQMKRPAVGDLQVGLQALGYLIADGEKSASRFGATTRQALLNFQSKHDLALSGEVDETTAASLNLALAFPSTLDGPTTWLVHGRITHKDGQPAAHVTVHVFDRDVAHETRLGETTTNDEGRYSLSYAESQFRRTSAERGGPELLLRIFGHDSMLLGQSKMLRNAPADATLDAQVATAMFSVFGRVANQDGSAVSGLKVVAVDRDLRREEALGTAVTDAKGHYEILYSREQFARAEKAGADLLVRALVDDQTCAESPVNFNAPAALRIDLVSSGRHGLSEFERIEAALVPLLDGLAPAELKGSDIDFLIGETGFPAATWHAYLNALRLVATVPEGLPLAALFGWQRTGQPPTWEALRAVRIEVLRSSLFDAIDRSLIPGGLRDALEGILARIPNTGRAVLSGLLDTAALAPEVAGRLKGRVDTADAISNRLLARLIDTKVLTREDALRIGLATSVHRLVTGDPAAIAAVVDMEFAALPGGRLREARDLAALDPGDWRRALAAAKVATPAGTTPEALARTRAIAATRAFPEAAFRHRVGRVSERLGEQVARLGPLFRKNKDALNRSFDALDGVPKRGRSALRADHAEVRALVNSHPGLGLREVLVNGGSEAVTIIQTRIGWVSEVLARNPDLRFSELDYLPDSPALAAIDFGDLPTEARTLVLADLRAHRRVGVVSGNAIVTQELLSAGYHSASAVARTPIAALMEQTGMRREELTPIHAKAVTVANQAALDWFGIYDLTRDRVTAPVRVIPTREQFFYPLTGYASLINDQPWCACEHCQSVLSPAAYFVDLMHYVETHILEDSFARQPKHPLHLEQRRPDLWELPLSCANTKDIVPTLDIVNEILENYIREVAPLSAGTSVFAHLAEQEASFRQPFTLPIEWLDTLLGYFRLSRHAVARSMRAPRAMRARARLGLSLRAYALMTTERTDPAYLQGLFGLQTTVTDPDTRLAAVEMQALVRATGLDHDLLAAALKSEFVHADGTRLDAVTIDLGKRYPNDVQNNTEVVQNLTFRRLDRLHRFVRLWRTLTWTVVELDYVLVRLAEKNAQPQIVADTVAAPGTLERITQLLELGEAWSIPLEQLLAITDAFPTKALRAPEPLFDRLFNAPGFAERDGPWKEGSIGRLTHPAWRTVGAPGVASPGDNTLPRLLAGLQLEDQAFVDLVAGLRADPALDYRAGTQIATESISLARASIASLYRHARVRALLRLSVADFVALLTLAPRGPGLAPLGYLRDADDAQTLLDFVAWREQSKVSVPELAYLMGGSRPSDVPDPQALARDLPATVATVVDAATRAATLADATPLALFDLGVGSQLARPPEEIALLRACVAAPSGSDLAAIVRVLAGGPKRADLRRVEAFLVNVVRAHRLLPRPAFDADGLRFLREQRSVFFGRAPAAGVGETISIDAIRAIMAYRALVTASDAGFSTAGAAPDIAAIRAVVTNAANASAAQIASALGTDASRVATLIPHLVRSGRPFDDLALVSDNLALAATLGVSGEALARMVDESNPATTFDRLSRAADDVLGAFRAKFADPVTLAATLEPYEDILRGRKRDGLVDYLITRWPTPFSSPDRLYDHFLIDVMVQGCARTSRVVSATSSVQLYVHRVLMNLERSADWNPQAKPPVGVWAQFNSQTKRDEWEWRQHYRVWEANRKVFLYPENYIEPELRDDRTPLFKEFEDALLTQDLTPQNLTDAYSGYLTGFDGLAQLQIAGAYRDVTGNTLHLFGVTQDDAPVYYYRSIDESKVTTSHPAPLYSAWHKVDLAIPVRKVSPVLFEGRLFLFWIENATRPINAFNSGTSEFAGYRHTVRVRYSTLRLDGTWAAPQLIRFAEKDGVADARIVEDPRDTEEREKMMTERTRLDTVVRPAFDVLVNHYAKERDKLLDALPAYVQTREDRWRELYAPLTWLQEIEKAALIAHGIPPDAAWWIVKAIAKALYQNALDNENAVRETLRMWENVLANAQTQLNNLDRAIADLDAAIAAAVIRVRWDRSLRNHKESLDSYHPDGWVWDRVYPEVCSPTRPDLPPGMQPPLAIRLSLVPGGSTLPSEMPFEPLDFDAVSGILRRPLVDEQRVTLAGFLRFNAGNIYSLSMSVGHRGVEGQASIVMAAGLEERGVPWGSDVGVAPAASDVQVVMGQPNSIIVQHEGDSVWLRRFDTRYDGMRLGTSLTRALTREFWSGGPPALLNAGFQRTLLETRSRIGPIAGQSDPKRQSPFHAEHPWLLYYRETFLHIPFQIADHLNSGQDFAAARAWYHTIFDPTATDGNVWRNRELAEPPNATTTLRDLLVDSAALDAYRKNPFNPHNIARTRMSAYAKSIVMKYIDNLLDWGDSLFAQFTMESLNEATMLYVMARDILGPRPAMLGSCGTGAQVRTYRKIRKGLNDVSDFLVELETPRVRIPVAGDPDDGYNRDEVDGPHRDKPDGLFTEATDGLNRHAVDEFVVPNILPEVEIIIDRGGPITHTDQEAAQSQTAQPGADRAFEALHGVASAGLNRAQTPTAREQLLTSATAWTSGGGTSVTAPGVTYQFSPAELVPTKDTIFCIPPNQELLGYWDRVEDRLFKIRNCRDISGARRRPDLFAPELDPRMLVRMTAAGLTIDDVLGMAAGQMPAYRFTFLIDKAKQHVGTVQAFGSQLLAALEKGDAEALNHLRTVHEQNLLALRRKLAQLEINAEEEMLASLGLQKEGVEYRRQHFVALLEAGTLPQEREQQDLQRQAAQLRTAAGIAQTVASILSIIPDFGAPTAMKFGGSQLGAAGRAVGDSLGAQASFRDAGAAMASIAGAVRRRDEEWTHQAETARRELAQLERGIAAAEIRRDIAVHSLEVHERTVAQAEEMFQFFRERFASVDRYRLLTKDLRRLYKIAFDSALRIAQMAEQAYRAERKDDGTSEDDILAGGYWDAQNAGLLAGERLLTDLQRLERQYLVRNKRKLEIEQSFSLAQFAPDKLAKLRLTGECEFSIPEWFFDLSYPGQYRRRIKAVRVTMPCVTGPYTNVGATLRLTGSKIRMTVPADDKTPLGEPDVVPLGHTVSIATSRAQLDAGVFEFGFRDERYLPFEGAGAISEWTLGLPKTLRMFDYDTISDVVIHLHYTADFNAELARRWDTAAQLVKLLSDKSDSGPPLIRRFSLRDELPDVFHRLICSPVGTEIAFTLDEQRFALFLAGHELEAQAASIAILTRLADLEGTTLAVAERPVAPKAAAFVSVTAPKPETDGTDGPLREFDFGSVLRTSTSQAGAGVAPAIVGTYIVKIAAAGALAGADANMIDANAVHDIVLLLGYRLAADG